MRCQPHNTRGNPPLKVENEILFSYIETMNCNNES